MDAMQAKAQAMAQAPAATVPDFARDFPPRVEADGRLFLVGDLCGSSIYVQPKEWRAMRFAPETSAAIPDAGASNGVLMPQLQAHAGSLQTNDAAFGQQLLAGTSAECRPSACPTAAPVVTPGVAALLAVAGVAAALILRFKPRGN